MSDAVDLPNDPRSLCEYLVRRLVDEPDSVSVTEEAGEGGTVLRIAVAPDDRGKVIGRQGRVVRALRTVVRAGGARSSDRVALEIVE